MEYWGRYRGQWDANFQQLSYLLLTWGHVQQGPESEKNGHKNWMQPAEAEGTNMANVPIAVRYERKH